MIKKRTVTWLGLALGSLLLLGLVGFIVRGLLPRAHSVASAAPVEPSAAATIQVEVVHPRRQSTQRMTTQPGSVHAFQTAKLAAGVSGYLKKLQVDIGDRVKKGDVLAEVAVPELQKQVQRYAALVEQARARVGQMKARATSARAEWEAARSSVPLAEATLKSKSADLKYRTKQLQRMRDLAESRSIEEKLVDEATSQSEAAREAENAAREGVGTARANVAVMAAKVQSADADIFEAEAQVKVAQAELEKAEVYVGFATVTAPFDGVITERNFFPGDFVRAATEGGTHLPLLTVQCTERMRVVVQIPDRDVPFCDPGDPATVEIDALPGEPLPAKVARIARVEHHDTRLMRIEIDLPNPSGKICAGMYGKVQILLDKSNHLAIPASCLIGKAHDGKGAVYVVRDGRAQRTAVTIAVENGVDIAIAAGVKETDEVILHPTQDVADGTPVVASLAVPSRRTAAASH